jgi:citrate lyase subunit beta/citryl-CoA lyase
VTHRLPLTWLYVSGDRPERIAKAMASSADVVIIDLEDAVAPERKAAAREETTQAAGNAAKHGRRVQVRVNATGSTWADADLSMVSALPEAVGVRLPKCESVEALRAVAGRLDGSRLHVLVETAAGLERAYELATAHPAVASVGLGEADLRADLGVTSDDGLLWARGRIVSAAAAAGLPPPSMSVFADVRDDDGLRTSCASAVHWASSAAPPSTRTSWLPSGTPSPRRRRTSGRRGTSWRPPKGAWP